MRQAAVAQGAQDPICLMVEDSQFDHMMMTRVIDRARVRFDLRLATTLQSARDSLAAQPVSLILLDNNLPDGTGANFALELADDPRFAHIPIIMVSDWPTPFMWDKAAKAGVHHIVRKSDFTVTFLLDALRRGFKRSRLQPRQQQAS